MPIVWSHALSYALSPGAYGIFRYKGRKWWSHSLHQQTSGTHNRPSPSVESEDPVSASIVQWRKEPHVNKWHCHVPGVADLFTKCSWSQRKEGALPLPGWIKKGFGEERIAGLDLKDVTEHVSQKHRRKGHHCTSKVWSPEYIHHLPAAWFCCLCPA